MSSVFLTFFAENFYDGNKNAEQACKINFKKIKNKKAGIH